MRAFASAATVVLVVLALLAGNCFSCPQMLVALASHHSSHGCCPNSNTPAKTECRTQVLKHFVKADVAAVCVVEAAVGVAVVVRECADGGRFATPVTNFYPPLQVPIRI